MSTARYSHDCGRRLNPFDQVASAQAENSDVFPWPSVAVAVTSGLANGSGTESMKLPRPPLFVFTVKASRNCSPSPLPVGSQAWLAKNSTVYVPFGALL